MSRYRPQRESTWGKSQPVNIRREAIRTLKKKLREQASKPVIVEPPQELPQGEASDKSG